MIVHNVKQGTPDWLRLRVGLPTASCFKRIVTPTGALSKSSRDYISWLMCELMLGRPLEAEGTSWMQRGTELESNAVAAYSFHSDIDPATIETVGFITNDAGTIGASPDRLVGDDGLLELKCPKPETHMGYLMDGAVDKDYYPQLQGQLYITGRRWVDITSFHPELPPVVIRVERDEEYIGKLTDALNGFVDCLRLKRIEIEDKYGAFPVIEVPAFADGHEKDFLTDADGEAIIAAAFPR